MNKYIYTLTALTFLTTSICAQASPIFEGVIHALRASNFLKEANALDDLVEGYRALRWSDASIDTKIIELFPNEFNILSKEIYILSDAGTLSRIAQSIQESKILRGTQIFIRDDTVLGSTTKVSTQDAVRTISAYDDITDIYISKLPNGYGEEEARKSSSFFYQKLKEIAEKNPQIASETVKSLKIADMKFNTLIENTPRWNAMQNMLRTLNGLSDRQLLAARSIVSRYLKQGSPLSEMTAENVYKRAIGGEFDEFNFLKSSDSVLSVLLKSNGINGQVLKIGETVTTMLSKSGVDEFMRLFVGNDPYSLIVFTQVSNEGSAIGNKSTIIYQKQIINSLGNLESGPLFDPTKPWRATYVPLSHSTNLLNETEILKTAFRMTASSQRIPEVQFYYFPTIFN